jgi:hypothetical protein
MGASGKEERNFTKVTLKKQTQACFPEYEQVGESCPKVYSLAKKKYP